MDERTKEAVLKEFQAYLEEIPEKGDREVEEGEQVDLFSLYSELTGLKSEVRIESRQLKSALDDFREVFGALDMANRDLASRFEELQQEKKDLETAAVKPVVSGLLDMYDRLAAAAAQEIPPSSFFSKFCRREREWIKRQAEGQQMTLRRLLDVLEMCGVEPVPAEREMFDPRFMKAVGTDSRADLGEGAVVAELRKGFSWRGNPLRAAEVIVNRLKGNGRDE